jgi:hypothetical protein
VNALVFSADGSQLFAAAGDAGLNGIAYQWRTSDGTLVPIQPLIFLDISQSLCKKACRYCLKINQKK